MLLTVEQPTNAVPATAAAAARRKDDLRMIFDVMANPFELALL
jgi:hypothetical protein